MLSQKTIDIVKSTAPILQEQGETLTRHFYDRMFAHNPEVAPYFNRANQAQGTQQRALAGAICAYAANIDRLQALGSAVELIAQKHASLMIKPEHYPIVGENLLASIREVLGDGASDDVINAWAEAYGFLATVLTGRESQIYDGNARKTGGWEGFRQFTVERKVPESSIITSFYLQPTDGGAVPDFQAGQYITVRLPTPDGSTTMRNYSLSDRPGQPYLRISVKREESPGTIAPDGYVSNTLHSKINVGDTLEIGPPCGEFLLQSAPETSRPLVLLAGGIGITPLMSMLGNALKTMPDRHIVLIHGALNKDVQAFRQTLEELASQHDNLTIHFRYSDEVGIASQATAHTSTGFIDTGLIEALTQTRDAEFYFCGPKPFMVNIYHELAKWGVPDSQVHFEFFGPKEDLSA